MKISVIIWFFDKISNLEKTFNSIFNQTYNEIEILIVNDLEAQTKNNKVTTFFNSIIHKKNITVIFKEKNEGISSAWNIGLAHSEGSYVWFLKEGEILSDNNILSKIFQNSNVTELKPDIIETVMSIQGQNPEINKCLKENKLYTVKNNKEVLVYMNMYINTKIFKKDIIEKINLKFKYQYNYDLLYIYKYLLNSKKYIYINLHSLIVTDNNYKFSYLNLLKQWPHIFNYINSNDDLKIYNEEILYSFIKYSTFTYVNNIKQFKNKILNRKSIFWISKRVNKKISLYVNNKYIHNNSNDDFNLYSDNIEKYLKKISKVMYLKK